MNSKFITFCTFQNPPEGIGHIGFSCCWHIRSIHIATKLKGTSRIGLHSFYKFVEIVVDVSFMSFWLRNVMDIVLTELLICCSLDEIRCFSSHLV